MKNYYNAEKKKLYYEINKEKILAKNKAYRENNKEKNKKYYQNNKSRLIEKSKKWRDENKEHQKLYRQTNNVKIKQYYENNKEKINKYKNNWIKNKKNNNSLYKLSFNIRCLVRVSITRQGFTKKSKTYQILGCSFEEFKKHLESQFESWMSWENYGLYNGELNYGWDIDHIIPTSLANSEENVIQLNHYSNLQPLCSKVNRDIKRNLVDTNIAT